MKNISSLFFLPIFVLLLSCGNNEVKEESTDQVDEEKVSKIDYMNREDLKDHITKLEKSLYEDTVAMDREKATELMEAYAMFASKHADHENSPEYIFKAGELAMGLNQTLNAIKYFSISYGRYPNFEKRPYALFLKAFVLENQAKDLEQATQTYETFIEEFPDHVMVDDAKYSIQNMGKTPEELIREFEAKQKQESVS